ncbi:hypothetical protein [Ruminococcus flavefaciens]|uniref:hypothetical protein n=1 Tax=Ruminococcus flavefaciens TaxID=1265 RepID=UPI0026F0F6CE|nr:hypothetical protein [Ruminococcus flavefaciens]
MTLKNAKRIYFTLAAAITVSGFLTVCTLGQAARRRKVETRLAAAAAKHEESPLFVVRESGGRAAVFRSGEDEPYLFIDIDTALLSDYDRAQLADGLYFATESGLRQFIEDISS